MPRPDEAYDRDDFSCDVALPHLDLLDLVHGDLLRELLVVVRDVATTVERDHGAAAVLTNVGHYQDSKHLHVHVQAAGG